MRTTAGLAPHKRQSIVAIGPVGAAILSVVLMYIGAEMLVPQYVTVDSGPLSLSLMFSGVVAVLGWRDAADSRVLRNYVIAAFLFGSWLTITSVAAWAPRALFGAAGVIAWACFVIPGIAQVIRHEMYRRPLLLGIVGGALIYGATATYRVLAGRSVTDMLPEGQSAGNVGLLLGRNRNIVSMGIIVAIAIVMERPASARFSVARLPLLAVLFVPIVYSEGRSALIGAALFLLLYGLFQPNINRRLRGLFIAALCATVFIVITQSSGGQAASSSNRLLDFFDDTAEKSVGDQARELDGRKAFNIGLDRPFFGIGFGNYQGAFHPVLEEAPTSEARHRLDELTAHNTYGLVLAEHGFPGVLTFIGMFAVLTWAVVRRSGDRAARSFGSGVVTVFFMLTFDGLLGTTLYIPMALLLGSLIAAETEPKTASSESSSVP